MLSVLLRVLAGTVILSGAAAGLAAANAETPAELVFNGNHLKLTKAGTELTYRFQKSVSHEAVLGKPFSDDLKLDITAAKGDTRDLSFQVFTGEMARYPQADHDRIGNPVLLWFLDRAARNYISLAGGGLTYIKGRFMEALRNGTAEPIKVDVAGKSVDAFRMTLQPYAQDPNAARMLGFENSKFIIVYSDAVPGYFVELSSTYENTDAKAPRLEERVSFVAEGEKK